MLLGLATILLHGGSMCYLVWLDSILLHGGSMCYLVWLDSILLHGGSMCYFGLARQYIIAWLCVKTVYYCMVEVCVTWSG